MMIGAAVMVAPGAEARTRHRQDATRIDHDAPAAQQAQPLSWFEQLFVPASQPAQARPPTAAIGSGLATWYGPGFHGRCTASGEPFNAQAMTAAHRTLPFGTAVRVVSLQTGRSVVVRINDRGPFRRGAVIDLSQGSARALGLSGTGAVSLHAQQS